MDVTHIPEFGRLKYLHVSVDTYSGVIYATPMAGEKVSHVKTHCLEAWAAWGKPARLKTDNGPSYTSKGFRAFCTQLQVEHTFGLPYNPQSQGIVERANRSLKEILHKQKRGMPETASPRERIALALFTLNFLIVDDKNHTAADRHAHSSPEGAGDVMWKDLMNNKWYGPDPVIRRSRGAVCVFPQNRETPVWVPSRLTRTVENQEEQTTPKPSGTEMENPVCLS
ncbi:Intracisternal A-particle Pol-related polyprotein (Fragment) [Lemmus lemmus]